MVCKEGPAPTTFTVWVTCGAAFQISERPDWSAWMTQDPIALKVTSGPSKKSISEHTELDPAAMEKTTSRPDVAVAVGRYFAPTGGLTGAVEVNEIVWSSPAGTTAKKSRSRGAGAKTESPPCV